MLFEVCNFTYTEPFGLQNMVVEMCVQPNLWCIFTRFPLLQRKKIHFSEKPGKLRKIFVVLQVSWSVLWLVLNATKDYSGIE